MKKWGRRIELAVLWIAVLAIPNFIAFAIVEHNIGGSAFNGYALDGHFFVGSHGHYKEVSPGIYSYSWWHEFVLTIHYVFMFSFAGYSAIREHQEKKRQKAEMEKALIPPPP